jgi:hypothetical protein
LVAISFSRIAACVFSMIVTISRLGATLIYTGYTGDF